MQIKKSYVSTIMSFIHVLFLFGPLYPLAGELSGLKREGIIRISIMGLAVIIPIVLSYYMLRLIKYLWIYYVLTFLFTVMLAVAGFNYGNFFKYGNAIVGFLNFGVCLIIFIVRSYSKIMHNEMKADYIAVHDKDEPFMLQPWEIDTFLSEPSAIHWGWMTVLYVLSLVLKLHYTMYIVFFVVLLDVFVCFVSNYVDKFFEYLKMNHRVANMPIASMKKIHKYTLAAGLILLCVFVLPAVIYHKEPLENVVLKRADVNLEYQYDNSDYMPEVPMMDTEMLELMKQGSKKEMPLWVKHILDLLLAAILIVCVCTFAIVIIRRIMNMAKAFQLEDEDEVINLDEVEEKQERLTGGRRIREYLSEKARIRRQYRKAIRKGTKGKPNRANTPSELEQEADFLSDPANYGLHEKYEKARYNK